MVELKDVLYELIHQTANGDLPWKVDNLNHNWRANRGDCNFSVENTLNEGLILKVAWLFYPGETNVRPLVNIGSGDSIKPLTDLLQEKYPFAPPRRPTEDDALNAALECLTERK